MERAADCRRQKPGAYPDRSGRVAQPVTENDRKVAGANTAAFCDRKPTTAACHMDGRQLTNQGLCDEQRLSRPLSSGRFRQSIRRVKTSAATADEHA